MLERGNAVEAPRLSFQIAPGSDLGEVASRLKKAGIKSERRSDITPGIGEAIAVQGSQGHHAGNFLRFRLRGRRTSTFTGIMPLKLGHIAYQCPDVQGIVKFYCDVLGFRVSDWRSDFFAFLRCSRDHHTVNFLRDGKTSIHHIAFEVRDWSDIKRACDLLARNNIKLTWGPIRHIIGHNIAVYHKNRDGVVIEFFCDMDQMFDEELGFFEPRPWHQDRPQRPKVWGDDTPSNWWGPMSRSAAHGDPAAPKSTTEPSRKAAPGGASAGAGALPARARRRRRVARRQNRDGSPIRLATIFDRRRGDVERPRPAGLQISYYT